MIQNKVYQVLSAKFNAMMNCKESGNDEWYYAHQDAIERIIEGCLPSGSGVDSGVTFNFDHSGKNKLVLNSAYHVFEPGLSRWIDFVVTVKPSLQFGFDLKLTGKFAKENGLKDYLHETFTERLNMDYPDGDVYRNG
tara:strand:- start:410 stop:820 length:411 start_codon:yes stop_codon:yes gene_type:complete